MIHIPVQALDDWQKWRKRVKVLEQCLGEVVLAIS